MRRALEILGLTVVMVLLLASAAFAATPQDIYDDYADNGVLDGTYTQAELQAYVDDATVHQYGSASVLDPLDDLAGTVLGSMKAGTSFEDALAEATGEAADEGEHETFPFTGFEMALALLAAIVLVGVGIALRRSAR